MKNCPYCFKPIPENGVCDCHYENSSNARIEDALRPGTIVGACYLIGAVLGKGGFGITYRAYDLNMQKVVAIKEFFPEGMVTRAGLVNNSVSDSRWLSEVITLTERSRSVYQKSLELFYREAVALGKLGKLPNVVHAHHIFRENGTAYIVMDFVEGQPLKSMIDERGKIPENELLPLLDPILTVLEKVHDAGIMHRDIAPDNIMIENGEPVLVDFGAARVEDGRSSSLLIGKRGYSSPEQMAGGVLDRRSDIYSMGATFYKALTGITPQDSTLRALADEVIPPRDLDRSISQRVSNAVMKAMAVKPAERFANEAEFQNALTGQNKQKPKPTTDPDPVKKSKTGLILAFLLVLAFGGIFLFRDKIPFIRSATQTDFFETQTAFAVIQTKAGIKVADNGAVQPTDTKTPRPTNTIKPTVTKTLRPTNTVMPTDTRTPRPTNTVKPAAIKTSRPTNTVKPTATKTPRPTNTVKPTSTKTPRPTNTVQPTVTKTPRPTNTEAPVPILSTRRPAVSLKKGEIFKFGKYEQDNNLNNGPEPIEWQVLAVENGRALLLSKYGLEAKAYNEIDADVTWEICTLRKWLNGDFYDSAFTAQEKEGIIQVINDNPDNPEHGTKGGNSTKDHVFLLSIDEAERYIESVEDGKGHATDYVLDKGIYIDKYTDSSEWWFRSPGKSQNFAASMFVYGYPETYGTQVNYDYFDLVRPSLWLKISNSDGSGPEKTPMSPAERYEAGEEAYWDGDYDKAFEYIIPAAKDGYSKAQFRLGYMYETGSGVTQSYETAFEWYQKAADQGNMFAQTNLGYLYLNGYGVEQSYENAIRWFRKAAEQEESQAQNNLGYMYQNGYGVEQSYETAAEWYQKAADQGNQYGQNNLGYLYENGLGVQKSIEKAREWYQKAADQGSEYGEKALERLSN